jgi:hypothetical protein
VGDYKAGLCLTPLGERSGCIGEPPKAHLEESGVTTRSVLSAMRLEQVRAAGQLYEGSGLSLVQVAAPFEVAPNTLRRALALSAIEFGPAGTSTGDRRRSDASAVSRC